jgi:hypothetical protein
VIYKTSLPPLPKSYFKPHKTRKLLLDISLSCQEISDFIDGKSFEDFQENPNKNQ